MQIAPTAVYHSENFVDEFAKDFVNVLWLSRHAPTKEQIDTLSEKLGKPLQIFQYSVTINRAEEVIELMKLCMCTEVVTVLPINLLASLLKLGVKPIRAVMRRVITENGEAYFHFEKYVRVTKVEIIEEDL